VPAIEAFGSARKSCRTWNAIATLEYPKPAPKSRENFTAEQLVFTS
jgi:hypothetical protein